jgi:hypothetical protein
VLGRAEVRAVNPRLTEGVRNAIGRGLMLLLLLYGQDDPYHRDFVATRPLDWALAGSLLRLEIVPGQIRGLTSLATQRAVADHVMTWLAGVDN